MVEPYKMKTVFGTTVVGPDSRPEFCYSTYRYCRFLIYDEWEMGGEVDAALFPKYA